MLYYSTYCGLPNTYYCKYVGKAYTKKSPTLWKPISPKFYVYPEASKIWKWRQGYIQGTEALKLAEIVQEQRKQQPDFY